MGATIQESYRDRRSILALETLLADIRFGARMMRRNPGFTFVAVVSLAAGIGAAAAVFSIVNAVVLRPLPVARPDHLRLVRHETHLGPVSRYSYLAFERFRAGLSEPRGIAAMSRVARMRTRAGALPATMRSPRCSSSRTTIFRARTASGSWPVAGAG
jgi:hypothetical protein